MAPHKQLAKKYRGDTSIYSSAANRRWKAPREGNAFIVEKCIDQPLDLELGVRQSFNVLDWGGVMDIAGPYFSHIVGEFYANIEDKDSLTEVDIRTYLRGQALHITPALIGSILQVPADGFSFEILGGVMSYDMGYVVSEAVDRLGLQSETRSTHGPERVAYFNHQLSPTLHLVHYILCHNVFPAQSSTNEIRLSDLYVLDRINKRDAGHQISLPQIILQQMRDIVRDSSTRRAFPFPILITRIAAAMGVPMGDEPLEGPFARDKLVEGQMFRLRLRRDKITDVWYSLGKRTTRAARDEEEHATVPPPQPEVGQSSSQAPDFTPVLDMLQNLNTNVTDWRAETRDGMAQLNDRMAHMEEQMEYLTMDNNEFRQIFRRRGIFMPGPRDPQPPPPGDH